MNMERIRNVVVTVLCLSLVLLATPSSAQTVVTGRVTSDEGRPLANANVYINELRIPVGTDSEGRENLTVSDRRANNQAKVAAARSLAQFPGARCSTLN